MMNRTTGIILLLFGQAFSAMAQEKMVMLNFSNAPLAQVLDFYEEVSGLSVTVEKAEYQTITIRTEKRLTVPEALSLIESNLAHLGIALVKTEGEDINTPDRHKLPSEAKPHIPAQPSPSPGYTGEELQKHLSNYQLEVIRAGLPPLPVGRKVTPGAEEPDSETGFDKGLQVTP